MDKDIATAPGDLPLEMIVKRHRILAGQFRHDGTINPHRPGPGQMVTVIAHAGAKVPLKTVSLTYRVYDPTGELVQEKTIPMTREPVEYRALAEYVRPWSASLPGFPLNTRVSYTISGRLPSGEGVPCQDGHGFWFNYPADHSSVTFGYLVRPQPTLPEWLRTRTIYQIFVDRFDADGATLDDADPVGKHGGTLAGITRRLPYLNALGIGCIWLSPIGPAPSYHRYDATDYFSVDSALGNLDDLRNLTRRAHDLGIYVILDFVPSHLSHLHPAFQTAQADSDSDTVDWFTFYEWPDKYRCFLEVARQLPSLRTDSKGVRGFLVNSAKHWIDCGIDGFRLDHVIGHGDDFWCEFQQRLEHHRPHVVTIGEATDTGDALRRYGSNINAILDFPLARALRSTFADGSWTLSEFDNYLTLYGEYMADGPGRISFLDNHDMDRFLHVARQRVSRLAAAALCLFTLSYPPVIYYGTEIGMTHTVSSSAEDGPGDSVVRQNMLWDSDRWNTELLTFFRSLIQLRNDHPALHSGTRLPILASATMLVYKKEAPAPAEEESFVVAVNLGQRQELLELDEHYRVALSFPDRQQHSNEWTLAGDSVLLLQRG